MAREVTERGHEGTGSGERGRVPPIGFVSSGRVPTERAIYYRSV